MGSGWVRMSGTSSRRRWTSQHEECWEHAEGKTTSGLRWTPLAYSLPPHLSKNWLLKFIL
eukprot:1148873-Pelagomonas_calceolata.AAC.2